MIAVVEAARAGLFDRRHWIGNIVAGIVVGVVALPLAMAFAIASGVKPEQGIYTAIIAGAAVSLFGGTRIQIAGPTGAFIVILAGVTAQHGVDGLLIATLMAGVILVLMGLARFGGVIRFIPEPVIVGFTAGIGVIIWVGQWQNFFGLEKTGGEHFHNKLIQLLQALPGLHLPTTLMALASLLVLLYGPRIPGLKRVPGPLLAMVAATLVQAIWQVDGVATISSAFGGIPQGLPHFALPGLSLDRVVALLPAAFSIALLGAIESLLSAVIADGMGGTRHDSNQELIGQGIANLLTPLFGGFAATGALARTATNFRNGGTSPVAGLMHSLTLVLILLFLAPLAAQVPLCALAAILFVVAWNMSEAGHFLRIVKTAARSDVLVLLITFVLTVFADLIIAVNIGVILAMFLFLRRMASSVKLNRVDEVKAPETVAVYSIEGPLFFGAVEHLEDSMRRISAPTHCVIVRLGHVPFMDITGLEALEEAIHDLEKRGMRLLLCEANPRVLRGLVKTGVVQRDQESPRYFKDLELALAASQAV